MKISRESIHRQVYIFSLILLVVAIPLSEYIMSNAQFLIALNWLVEGKFREKLNRLTSNNALWIFLSLILLHVLWLINSTDMDYGLKDIRIKLPLLIIPLIVGTSKLLSKKEFKLILLFFVKAVSVGSFISSTEMRNIP